MASFFFMKIKFKISLIIYSIFNIVFTQNGDAMEHYLKGEYAKLNDNLESALMEFKKALILDSNSVIILNQIANCYKMMEDTSNASKYYLNAFYNSNYSVENGIEILDYFDSVKDIQNSRLILDSLKIHNPLNIELKSSSSILLNFVFELINLFSW